MAELEFVLALENFGFFSFIEGSSYSRGVVGADTCNGKGLGGKQSCRCENDFKIHGFIAPRMFCLETK